MAENIRARSPKRLGNFKVRYDFYHSPQGPHRGDRMERDEVFYKDKSGKTMVMYPKELVYPPSGGEYSLEEIRARLPQYQVDFDKSEDVGMELTCVPQIPPVYESSDVKKVEENVPSGNETKVTLESLCSGKENLGVSAPSKQPTDYCKPDNVFQREVELEQLLTSKGRTPNLLGTFRRQGNNEGYGFTPQTGPGWSIPEDNSILPQRALSYSDTQSFSTTGSTLEGSQTCGTFGVYEDSADQSSLLRRSAVVKNSGVKSSHVSGFDLSEGSFKVWEDSHHVSRSSMIRDEKENQFQVKPTNPVTETTRQPLMDIKGLKQRTLITSQSNLTDSFQVYEDSVAEKSSYHDDFVRSTHQVPQVGIYGTTKPSTNPQTASIQKQKQLEDSYSGVQMAPPPRQGESVFEQSITVMGIPRPPEPLGKLSSTPNHLEKTASLLPTFDVTEVLEFSKLRIDMPSSVPSCSVVPPPPPAPNSQPKFSDEGALNKQRSQCPERKQTDTNYVYQPVNPQTCGQRVLDTITEEQSGSTGTPSSNPDSSGSRNFLMSTTAPTVYDSMLNLKKPINPFKPEVVDYMLRHIHMESQLQRVKGSLPQQLVGAMIDICGMTYQIHEKIGEGAFATVYRAVGSSNGSNAVKVQKPADCWEFAIVKEIQLRLSSEGGSTVKEMFVNIIDGSIVGDTSLLVLQLYPLGTLLDLVNKTKSVSEQVVAMVMASILTGVGILHHMDILHGDIKPDNLLIRRLGCDRIGIVLSDFSRAIDLRAFPKDMVFFGSSHTSAFECLQMRRNEPWKWQVDTYAMVVTLHILAHRNYNFEVVFCEETLKYRACRKIPRHWHQAEWHGLMGYLINTTSQECPNFQRWIDVLSGYTTSVVEEDILQLFN